MTPHWEALPRGARRVIEGLGTLPLMKHAYLAGGTGLALQIGHRISHDVDLFTNARHVTISDRRDLFSQLRRIGRFVVGQEHDGVVMGELLGVKVSFVPYPFRIVTRMAHVGTLRVASPMEIGAMKVATVMNRGAKRDFIDLAAILDRCATLRKLIGLADRKFPGTRDLALRAAKAIEHFHLADRDADPRMLWPGWTWEEVKRRLEREARRLARRTLG